MNAVLLSPLYTPAQEAAMLDEIYRELEASGHTWPELTAAEADELERLDNCRRGTPHEL